eukprot:3524832-Lingulodinium_polyedra.AAC.1
MSRARGRSGLEPAHAAPRAVPEAQGRAVRPLAPGHRLAELVDLGDFRSPEHRGHWRSTW